MLLDSPVISTDSTFESMVALGPTWVQYWPREMENNPKTKAKVGK
jgi:hypothetical protein